MSNSEYDLIIEAGKTEREYWKDLWKYRELLYFLSLRDLLVRYKQTVLGIAWSILRPLLTMISFFIVFHSIAKLDSGNTPYALTIFVGLVPWQLFSTSLSESSNSLVTNSNLISKIYFPRMIVPISSMVVSVVDFLISLILLALLLVYYGYMPSYRIVYLPVFFILSLVTSLGAGLAFAALNVKFRDFRYVIPFVLQLGLYISPVGFSSTIIPEQWRFLYSLNPMVGIIDGFRWCVLKEEPSIYLPSFFISLAFIFCLMFIGIKYFRSTEKLFADKI